MSLNFIHRFRDLHEKAKQGPLVEAERLEYAQSRRELGRLLLVAQQMSHRGETLRNALRIAQLIKVDIELGAGASPPGAGGGGPVIAASTIDLAGGGFAVLLPSPYAVGRAARFTLHLPAFEGGQRAVQGTAKVASSRPQGGLHRVSFAFVEIGEAERDYLEMIIIDYVLRRFAPPK